MHPVEGITMEVSYTSEVKGFAKFPSCRNVGSGISNQYPHGVADSSHQGTLMIGEEEFDPATQQFRVMGYEWI